MTNFGFFPLSVDDANLIEKTGVLYIVVFTAVCLEVFL